MKEALVPYSSKTVIKNKKTKNVFDNCELAPISKALIPLKGGLKRVPLVGCLL
jgi:hypothetical protein